MTRQGNHPKGSKNVAVTRLPTRQEIKQLRTDLNESATAFGKRFGYARSTIKTFEGGSKRPNQEFAKEFWKLRSYMPRVTTRVVTQCDLPPIWYLDVAPTQCRGHQDYHVFKTSHQVYCKLNNGECRRLWKRRERAEDPNHSSTRTHRPQNTNAKKRKRGRK